MYEYWKLDHFAGAVQWIEDTDGKLIVFTRGEYKELIRAAIGEQLSPEQFFQHSQLVSERTEELEND